MFNDYSKNATKAASVIGVEGNRQPSSAQIPEWVLFMLLLGLPMFMAPVDWVDRSIVNLFSLCSSALIYLFIQRKITLTYQIYLTYFVILIFLYIQYVKTAVGFGVADGFSTLLRYIFYLTVGLVTYKRGIEEKSLNVIIFMAVIICIFSSVLGVIQDRYIWLNGWNRFMGANYSSAALALEASMCLFLVYIKFFFLKPSSQLLSLNTMTYIVLSVALLYILYLTGSRGPLLGVIFLMAMHIFFNHRKLFFILAFTSLFIGGALFEASSLSSNRLLILMSNAAEVAEWDDLKNMGDGSVFSRIKYIEVGSSYIYDQNLAFGAGLNSFQGIYEASTGKDSVAPHNDFLLVLVEFGYIGLGIFLLILTGLVFRSLRKRNLFTLFIIGFWFFGFSLNNVFYYHSVATLLVMVLMLSLRSNIRQNT
jgi:hypothetical protein